MYYEHVGDNCRVVLFAIEDKPIKTLETPCNILISPLAEAEVIVYLKGETGETLRLVFDAVTGMLPNQTTVIGVKDDEGSFPSDDEEIDIRIIFEPFSPQDSPRIDRLTATQVSDPCPLCGRDIENHDTIDDEDDEPAILPFNRLDFHFNQDGDDE